jgi:hypothetical protein
VDWGASMNDTRGDKLALIGVTVGWLTVGTVVTGVIYSVYW